MQRLSTRALAFVFALFLGFVLSFSAPAAAQQSGTKKPAASAEQKKTQLKKSVKSKNKTKKKKVSRNQASRNAAVQNRYAALVVDADTGRVLHEHNAGSIRYPASLTKMMTLYLTFDALKRGKLDMDDAMAVSAKAAAQPQTNISLNPGDRLPVRAAIESLVVRSANDAAMVLAEAIGGTEWNFALMMTNKARELGMDQTVFRNPSGLPDNKQHTTAFDMARLAIALRRDFPDYYPVFKLTHFTYNGIEYPSHNKVLEAYPGADGVKTGYIRASGFNLVTSVRRDGYNLVAVVMGGRTASARDNEMVQLLDRTMAKLAKENQTVAERSELLHKNNYIGGLTNAVATVNTAYTPSAEAF